MANDKKILSKAWDNRYGCGLAIELLKEVHGEKFRITCTPGQMFLKKSDFVVLRAAATMINPDLFFALDASPANDATGDKNEFGQLGKGNCSGFLTVR